MDDILGREWAIFFDDHAPVYEDNCFTKNTLEEVDFIIEELGLEQGQSILDVGCGTGRHSIELAKRGFLVTGIDLSDGMLKEARSGAESAGVEVEWIHANAQEFEVQQQYDAAICVCEGAFGLLGRQDDPVGQPEAILGNIAAAMKPGAKCLFTVLNGYAAIRKHTQSDVEQKRFDPLTLAEVSECDIPEDGKIEKLRERGFVPTELVLLFALAGLEVTNIWGGTAGSWNKEQLDLDEIEVMVMAHKSDRPVKPPYNLYACQ